MPADNSVAARALGEHADNYLKIELHDRIAEPLPLKPADITEHVYPTQPQAGLNPYPSKASLMAHLLLHAAGTMACRALRLVQLHDVALLSTRMSATDWEEALWRLDGHARRWWALPPLLLTSQYYPTVIPSQVLVTVEAACPPLLRRVVRRRTVSQLSLSTLYIEAFPGIEWSQSLSEAAHLILSRVFPSREVLKLRTQVAHTRISASETRWQQLPQFGRMLLWMGSRQPRAETLYPVRLALTEARNRSRNAI